MYIYAKTHIMLYMDVSRPWWQLELNLLALLLGDSSCLTRPHQASPSLMLMSPLEGWTLRVKSLIQITSTSHWTEWVMWVCHESLDWVGPALRCRWAWSPVANSAAETGDLSRTVLLVAMGGRNSGHDLWRQIFLSLGLWECRSAEWRIKAVHVYH